MKIVCFSGRGETGKDHMCRLVQSAFGFRQLGFSDVPKWYGIGRGWWTWSEAYITKPPQVRTLMQQKMTEEHRDQFGEDIWVKAFFGMVNTLNTRFGDFDRIVMMDGRFLNEIQAIEEAGGLVIRLESDKANATLFTEEQKQHRSESELDRHAFEHVVDNSESRWELAEAEVYSLVWEYLNDGQ